MNYAPFKIRIYAFFIDYIIIALYGVLVVGSISYLFRPAVLPLFTGSPVTAQWTGFLLITLPVTLYFLFAECSKWQGTIGKRKLGIRVADRAGNRIEIGRSFIRTGIKFLPWEVAHFSIWRLQLPNDYSESTLLILLIGVNVMILLYLVTPFMNKKKKNLYDGVAGTMVIR
ncbi:RDD family protein [Halobacillus fulvus]|nr:RDD family protein [Halobacillus fulvus]